MLALPLGLASMLSSCLGCIAAAHILVSEFLTAMSWTISNGAKTIAGETISSGSLEYPGLSC